MVERLLIIGWDGADWEILDDLIARGHLPTVAAMKEEGASGNLVSTIPTHSWAAWSTFLTGLNPGGHGVFDFVERHPTQPDRRIPVSSASIKAATFLERLSEAGQEVRVANVPVTFPPVPVKGRVISGVAIPPGVEFVYPKEWAGELKERAEFPINGMEWTHFKADPEKLVREARTFIERRTRSFEVLLEGDWTVAVCAYLAPDRLQHPFGAYLLPSHPDHERLKDSSLAQGIREAYEVLDRQIETLRSIAGPDATVCLMSDHGFRALNRISSMNQMLGALGFAAQARTAKATTSLRRSSATRRLAATRLGLALKRRIRRPSSLDWGKTVAYYSATGGGVSINLKGREPHGTVAPEDYERVREEVRLGLLSYKDPETGTLPVSRVHLREELYRGPYVDLAPDLLVEAEHLWSLSHGDVFASWTDWPSGTHRRSGILLAAGGRTIPGDLGVRDIADVAATALAFCGVPFSGLEGRVIQEIAGQPAMEADVLAKAPETTRAAPDLSDKDQERIAQHLRDLGYIE